MLTKETVSGLRKITCLVDGLVKRFPALTHQQIAQLLVEECAAHLEQLRIEIAEAKEAGKNPHQKQGYLGRLEKYQPIVDYVADMLVKLGQPQIVEMAQAA